MSWLREWWRTLGYCWNRKASDGEVTVRCFGLRPWGKFGKRMYWFVIDDSDTAQVVQKEGGER